MLYKAYKMDILLNLGRVKDQLIQVTQTLQFLKIQTFHQTYMCRY